MSAARDEYITNLLGHHVDEDGPFPDADGLRQEMTITLPLVDAMAIGAIMSEAPAARHGAYSVYLEELADFVIEAANDVFEQRSGS